jgi:hypothetical protein
VVVRERKEAHPRELQHASSHAHVIRSPVSPAPAPPWNSRSSCARWVSTTPCSVRPSAAPPHTTRCSGGVPRGVDEFRGPVGVFWRCLSTKSGAHLALAPPPPSPNHSTHSSPNSLPAAGRSKPGARC